MAELFKMPKLGMDMEEGIVVRWLKAEGDKVEKGESLAEIETDKSSVEVESPASGTVLKLYCSEDEALPCGTPIACIGNPGETIPDPAAPEDSASKTEPTQPAAPKANQAQGIFYMPKLGMDMEEGIITRWLKAEGDMVEKGEPLAEIETDKSSVEVESPASGIVRKLYCSEDEALPCGTPIAFIGGATDPIPDPANLRNEAVSPAPVSAPAATAPMDTSLFFCMPKLGMDMEEGIVATWLKAEGDTVEKGEAIAEIETDKSSVEVESPLSGVVLKIYGPEGEVIPCGEPIAAIGPAGTAVPEKPVTITEAAPAETPAEAPASPVAASRPAPTTGGVAPRTPGGRIKASPRARRLAEEKGVDISMLKGTGMDDRIIEQDVLAYLENAVNIPATLRVPQETIVPLSGVRKVTARRMRQSLSNTAQTNHRVDVDVTNLMAFRKQVNARLEKDGIKVSIVDILAMSCAKALMENPMANAYLMDDGLHMHNYANIGIACDTPKGLMVPVVKDVDILTLPQLAKASKAVISKARDGVLKPDDMSGGTFTISNLGMYEIDSFTAVLNPPETCILAVGRIMDRVVAENGQMVIRPMMNLCLTYDHQVLDGAPAAQFLQTIKHYIENPVWLML